MSNRLFILGVLVVAGCATTPKPPAPKPHPELVTRRSKPFMPAPTRMAGKRGEVSKSERESIEKSLKGEFVSTKVEATTAIDWKDGTRSIFVVHSHVPTADMSQAEADSHVDQSKIDACEKQFAGCASGEGECDQTARDECMHAAYDNEFVYMASDVGMDCSVVNLSRYSVTNGRPVLQDRKVIDPIACDFYYPWEAPAATDLDGDGGPELVYSWTKASTDDPQRQYVGTVDIIDANDMHSQYRKSVETDISGDDEMEHAREVAVDVSRDGKHSLLIDVVSSDGSCPQTGFSLGPKFTIPTDKPENIDLCRLTVVHEAVPYDAVHDRWGKPASQPTGPKPPSPRKDARPHGARGSK